MNKEYIIGTALRALPSDNMRKEEMFAVECAMRMVADFVLGDMPTIPADKDATIRELTVECIARARRIDELEKEMAGLLSDNKRISVDRERAIGAIVDGVMVTDDLQVENTALRRQLSIYAHRIDVLDSLLRVAKVNADESDKQKAELQERLNKLTDRLDSTFPSAFEIAAERDALRNEIDAMRTSFSKLVDENATLHMRVANYASAMNATKLQPGAQP